MTMKRKAKADHQFEIKLSRQGDGMTDAHFASPREIAARDGRTQMTTAEYIEHRMGRRTRQAAVARMLLAERSRYPRTVTRAA